MQPSRMKSHMIGNQTSQKMPIYAYLYITTKDKPLKMTISTSTDVTFTGWCDRIVAKHWSCYSKAPADKQVNESNLPLWENKWQVTSSI